MTEHVRTTTATGILTLTLARPEKKNAITNEMYACLADAIEAAGQDPAIRVIVIRGDGDGFTAGNDLKEFAGHAMGGQDDQEERHVVRFLRAIATTSRPLLAAVQGRAVGIGTTMLLHCDFVVLCDDALLTTPFVGLGLVPEAASSLLLPARVGHVRAFEMFALGEAVTASQAVGWGIANRAVPRSELDAEVQRIAERLARQPAGSLKATRKLMRHAEAISSQMAAESIEFIERLKSPEAREAFLSFAQRRPADFSRFGA